MLQRHAVVNDAGQVTCIVNIEPGSFDPGPGFTLVQSDTVQMGWTLVAGVPTGPPSVPRNLIYVAQFIRKWLPAEYTLLMRARTTAITAGNIALVQLWDAAIAQGVVDLNTQAAQDFKAAIVAAGILTQQRADIIFS